MHLREIRKEKGFSQTELAKKANVHRVSISLYESGKKKPSVDSLQRLAAALEVTTDEILGESA